MGNGALGTLQRYINLHEIDAIVLHLHRTTAWTWRCARGGRWDPMRMTTRDHPPLRGLRDAHLLEPAAHAAGALLSRHGVQDFHVWQPRQPVTVGPFTVTPSVKPPVPGRLRPCGSSAGVRRMWRCSPTPGTPIPAKSWFRTLSVPCEASPCGGGTRHPAGIHLTGRRAGRTAGGRERGVCCSRTCPCGTTRTAEAEACKAFDKVSVARPARS
ncbi:MBL fold metallo-hydrolase [Kocuria rhizophila]|nr:MBL fold metallo-hydrolase [Kocuria rhizophila]